MADQHQSRETEVDTPLEAAARRLDRAMALLESRVNQLTGRGEGDAGGLFDFDRSQLASELDAARARERELVAAGVEASLALGLAIDVIRRALKHEEQA
jgi:hypothetical protein